MKLIATKDAVGSVLCHQFALVPHRAPGRRLDLDQVRSHFLSPCHFFDRAHLENGRRLSLIHIFVKQQKDSKFGTNACKTGNVFT